jgi:hypothetical protein
VKEAASEGKYGRAILEYEIDVVKIREPFGFLKRKEWKSNEAAMFREKFFAPSSKLREKKRKLEVKSEEEAEGASGSKI